MRNSESFTLKTVRLSDNGAAVAEFETGERKGKKCFIWGALPNEIVEVEIIKERSKFVIAKAVKIIKSNPKRVEPKDSGFINNAPWQIFEFDFENSSKKELVKQAFRLQKFETLEVKELLDKLEIKTNSQEFGYRNKYEYFLNFNEQNKVFNFAVKKRETDELQNESSFSIVKEIINNQANLELEKLNNFITETPPNSKTPNSLTIRSNKLNETINMFDREFESSRTLKEDVLGNTFEFDLSCFFQVNVEVFEMFLKDAISELTPNINKIVDFYSGVGVIGITIAKNILPKTLNLVDVNANNVSFAKKNAQNILESILDVNIIKSDAKNANKLLPKGKSELLIVDPPRAGLDSSLIKQIVDNKIEQVLYLSCNPVTFARDTKKLTENGYSFKNMFAYNFFPKTPHIEISALLSFDF